MHCISRNRIKMTKVTNVTVRPLIQCCWSVGLEFPDGQLVESNYWREQFHTIPEDVSVRNILMHSAH